MELALDRMQLFAIYFSPQFTLCLELIESVMYLYRATGDSYLLEIGEDMLRSIQHSAKTSCGFATVFITYFRLNSFILE